MLFAFNRKIYCLRNEIKSACQSANKALIVSFGRKVLGQTGSGHFAPVGKYWIFVECAVVYDYRTWIL